MLTLPTGKTATSIVLEDGEYQLSSSFFSPLFTTCIYINSFSYMYIAALIDIHIHVTCTC